MHIVTKRMRVELWDFRYIVALYFIYLRIKFDDKIIKCNNGFVQDFVKMTPKYIKVHDCSIMLNLVQFALVSTKCLGVGYHLWDTV